MPICDNNKNKPSPIAAADVDHQAEIAKAKISREQAYFNSYDFDAIEVVPLDEDEEEADPNCDSIKQTPDAGNDGSDLGHQVPSGVYLKRLTSYFTAATRIRHLNKIHQTSPSTLTTTTPGDTVVGGGGEDSQSQSDRSNSSSSSSRNSSRKLYKACGDGTANHGARNNFSLPRAMLKYQSALAASSMSAAGMATCTTSISKVTTAIASSTKPTNNRLIYGNQKSPGNVRNSGFIQCYGKSGDRERVISASHYSTDKSGSSGYYSSNVCSTSSVEEHIYSEPVVDIIETRLAPLKQLTLPLQRTLEQQRQGITRVAEGQSYYNVEIHDSKITEELQLLETSIENLDRHLKSYPRLNSPSPSPKSSSCTVYDEVHSVQNYDKIKSSRPMPTIMEGTDAQSLVKTPASWTEEMDDSLMDIDLDSFLLVNEVGTKPTKAKKTLAGIDNPTFNKTKVLHEEVLENNYKCSKYVNSCPEDAYKVESVIETVAPGSGKEPPDKSLAFFLKKYEDQIHFQNTKDMLEDIRTKVISLTNNSSGDSPAGGHQQLPKDLEKHIAILKLELEAYLRLMNYSNELEIKQLCTGLVNDQKLMTITKAFERRRSLTSDYELAYEPLRASSYTTLPYGTAGQDDSGSIACSDPNFQLKRKPIIEGSSTNRSSHHYPTVVNDDEFGDNGGVEKDIIVVNDGNSEGKTVLNVSQLQKNLSFQRPILDIRGKGDDDKDKMLECHTNKPSIWELYYGTNRIHQKLAGQRGHLVKNSSSILSYPSSRPESDFTLDLPKAEQLRLKMEKEKKFRQRCRILTTFLSLVFFLLTVMVVSLILTRGKRMFGSML